MKILVVEDEPLIRLGIASLLEDEGFETCEAANADAAIRMLQRDNDIRLVVTDVDMPGTMDGLRLAHHVRNKWPPVELIVISGKVGVVSDQLPLRAKFFSKPYPERDFLRVVGQMMGRGGYGVTP